MHCLITFTNFLPLYSISIFLPTIIRGMGYTNETAQLLTVPPYFLACLGTVGIGFAADRLRIRGLFVIGLAALA